MIASSLCNASAKFPAEVVEVETMMEQKSNLCSVDESSLTSLTSKRRKADFSISAKEKKDKLGERIMALQQLVSPFGKTDTASVLLEAMEYIQFLHEQVKVLSAPYLQSTPTVQLQEMELPYNHGLRNKGLCLVPISCTAGVARSNGADIWAPVKTTSPKFEKTISPFN
ncbi:transcription factor bHLH153-like isoform X1 [Cucurbita maxima]|uniref:Transcription factor bHLH153-like isoform X1 n=2 Tax=Cucurbita maxima TaxID=3661 RepID=A0A6J1I7K4_CUCMA|nr:transcription factor bHLH153-like isoform X1 [Cucurbita maxima]